VLSIGLGGGSRVRSTGDAISVGPDSVGFKLRSEGLVFGGSTLTATDIAVAAGVAQVGNTAAVRQLDSVMVRQALQRIGVMIEDAIDRMKTSSSAVPVVLVGGGSILAPSTLRGAAKVIIPAQAGVANAIGAAIAQVSGEVDQVYSYEQLGRDAALDRARTDATNKAIAAGADAASVHIADVEELPLQYLPGGAVRVRVKAIGELAGWGV
jgi:N-methylhydantoinase A/oxoprolinase/acetone carboxylase beta subunit